MKKTLRNITTLLLLACYLTGFCGFHLVKHSCFSCDSKEFSLHFSNEKDNSHAHYHCCQKHGNVHCCSEESVDTNDLQFCCDYQLLYFKINPKTLVSKNSKPPMAMQMQLLLSHILSSQSLALLSNDQNHFSDLLFLPYEEPDQENLCCFLC
jgi:hypothetical protein